MGIKLNNDNYYSKQANMDYMSVSQFKDFAGTFGHNACEMAAYKNWLNPTEKEWTKSLLVGSYVDAYFEGNLDAFKEAHQDLLCTKTSIKRHAEGKAPLELYADFRQADVMIAALEKDPVFMDYCSGEKQAIMTANLFGIEWKIRMDFYKPHERIADLKIIKNMQPIWSPSAGKVDFIHYWGYDIQGAIYQKVVEMNTGERLPFFICCATKEDVMDHEIIEIGQNHLDKAFAFVQAHLPHVLEIKNGLVAPVACGTCASCKTSKLIKAPISLDSIMPVQHGAFADDIDVDIQTEEPPMEPASLW